MLYRALKMWFWVTYDHLGRLLILNFACALPIAMLLGLGMTLPGPLGHVLTFVAFAIAMPGALAALGAVARALVEHHEAPFSLFFDALWRYGTRGAMLGAAAGVVVLVSLVGIYYYLVVVASPAPWYVYPLAAVCAWVGAFTGVASAFALAALSQKRAGILAAIRTGVLLVADNPVFCVVITLHLAGIAVCALSMPLFLLFSLAPMATLLAAAYEMLARKYAAPIVDGKRQLTFDDDADDYLNRGMRDFFFPWKM